jgi:hypothetical protein
VLSEDGCNPRMLTPDIDPDDLLFAVSSLCMSTHSDRPEHAERMVALLIDGLRYGAKTTGKKRP